MISKRDIARLRIVSYPDPVLRRSCKVIERFDDHLPLLAEKMCTLMHEHKGVGLAGPQVGVPLRIFVWNPTGEPENDQVCLNSRLTKLEGQVEFEEGCLSIEGVTVKIKRARFADIEAQRLDGSTFQLTGEDIVARIWQHESDHLDGRLILDYMSPAEEIVNRRALKELEAKYKNSAKRGAGSARR